MSGSHPSRGAAAGRSPQTGGRYAFLRTGRWLRLAAIALVTSLGCAAAGVWQWDRHSTRLEAVERVQANYDAEPTSLAGLVGLEQELAPQDEWRPIRTTGEYAPGGTVLLRNRPVTGTPAHHVLGLLVVTIDGQDALLLVDRGWVPAGSEAEPGGVPEAPAGEVTVLARLRPTEDPDDRTAPAGQTQSIDAGAVAASAVDAATRELPVLPAYGVLETEDPAPGSAPVPLPAPDTDLGTHLSYTFQWWVFATGALVGFAVLARREAEALADGGPQDSGYPVGPARRGSGSRRRRTAAQEEDELIDAQLAERNTASGRG